MSEKSTKLSVSTEVLEKMTELAAKEVEGVVGLCKRKVDLKGAVKSGNPFKGVLVENQNDVIALTVYICVKQGAKVRAVAEAVQEVVKDRVQTMTGTVVSRVNVVVADLEHLQKATEKTEE